MTRVRFAPSPTGHLHVGGARTAIFNWLFARNRGGKFILRIEDTDQARSTRESEAMVLEDLRWLGLEWDEGPFRQSERTELYNEIAKKLVASEVAYRCYCTEEELEAKRKQAEVDGRPPHYDLKCWYKRAGGDTGAPHAIRFHVPESGDVTIQDLIRGEVTWKRESLGDFIIVRSDGLPTYNFCVVVDDHDMEITHVIRAEEHLTNTHRQVLIYRALQWRVPEFAHVSLILGADRSKLSKRHGATSVSQYADDGFLPDAMLNYLTLLGWSSPDGAEKMSREELVAKFSLDRVNPAPAVFDSQKLDWLNGQYIHAMSAKDLRPLVARFFDAPWLEEGIEVVKTSVHRLTQFEEALRFVREYTPPADIDQNFVRALLDELRAGSENLFERMKAKTGLKGKPLFQPLRLAITGSDHGPELVKIIPLLEHASKIDPSVLSPLARVEKCIR